LSLYITNITNKEWI